MPIMDMLPKGDTLQIPLDAPTSLAATAGNAQVELTWTDPADKYAANEGGGASGDAVLVSQWAYTRVVRKQGSAPESVNDGVLICESSVRDQYATAPFVDSQVENDVLYYYGLYAFTTTGIVSEGAVISATPHAGTALSALAVGTLIKILENGSPVEFYLAKHNYESGLNGAGRELVVRKDCYDRRSWSSNHSNAYDSSDLDSQFNSTYKNRLDADIRSLIGTTKFYYTPGNGNDTVGTLERAIFALSLTELGRSHFYANTEGSALPIASTLQIAYRNGSPTAQWTRSPRARNLGFVWLLESGGAADNQSYLNSYGYRPAFTLPSTVRVDENMNVMA